jgi:arginyl-tRNA synthetase
MEDVIKQAIREEVTSYNEEVEVELSYPEAKFGDYATNVALKLAQKNNHNPRELAEELAAKLKIKLKKYLSNVTVDGPGFINLTLSMDSLWSEMDAKPELILAGKTIVIEFGDPNPFKILHAGHLYTSIVGDSIANLLARSGAKVYRVNYGGDVGLHVGKTIWAMLEDLGGANPEQLEKIVDSERSQWMSQAYVRGSAAYDNDQQAKAHIIELNKRIYEIQATKDHDSSLAKIYWITREWSYEAFVQFYKRLNIHFDKFYPESMSAPIGVQIVKDQLEKGVFEKSDGAIVFKGEKYGLHTRVFINNHGLPTYEAKDLGLAELKVNDYDFDQSIIITGKEQQDYMAVVYKAIEQFAPKLAHKTMYIAHGMVRMSGGRKMSSRTGNYIIAEDILDIVSKAAHEINDNSDDRSVLAAVKYAFLKQRLGGDIIYEPEESVSILGNSGPYMQYAYARAKSILAKAKKVEKLDIQVVDLNPDERSLVLKLSRYTATINQACKELSPHILCTYLYDLTQEFNYFYEHNRVVGNERETVRLVLVGIYSERLKSGLDLLGIETLERL